MKIYSPGKFQICFEFVLIVTRGYKSNYIRYIILLYNYVPIVIVGAKPPIIHRESSPLLYTLLKMVYDTQFINSQILHSGFRWS